MMNIRELALAAVLVLAVASPGWAACTPSTSSGTTSTLMGTQNADRVSITGGCVDGAAIGQNTPAAGTFTTLATSQGPVLATGGSPSATTGLTAIPIQMIHMRTAAGLMMTGSASGTNFGLIYTPGTTAILTGTATSSNSTSDVAATDFTLPPNYKAGSDITLKVGCYYTDASGAATVKTVAAAAYLNGADGLQGTTLIATAAQICPITTSAQQTFTITGATLVPGSMLTLTFTAAVTNATGASTERVTSVVLN
jgi:hypothetical protein